MSNTALQSVAKRLSVSETELQSIVMKTVMPSNVQVSNEQFVSFMAVANEYKLNPLVKEIYAFPAKGGGIQPIVSIDGWLRIINSHQEFNGMTFKDVLDDKGNLVAVTCSIYKKGIEHPVQVTEYMSECKRNTDPWKQWPARMLRHKAAIQGGRYAFGISGIIDPDEAERYQDTGAIDMGEAKRIEFVTEQDIEDIKQAASEKGLPVEKILAAYGLSHISELPLEKLAQVMDRINNYKKGKSNGNI